MADTVAAGLRRQAAELERLAKRLRRSGLPGAAELEARRQEALEVAAELEALTGPDKPRNLSHMEQAQVEARRRVGRPTQTGHAFPRALEAAGTTVAAWARGHGLKRQQVASWFAPRPNGRAIPARYADEIERSYRDDAGQPLVPRAAWPNGVRD